MAPSENSTAGDVAVLVDACWSPSSSPDERRGVLPVAVHTQATVLAILRDPQVDGGPPRLSTHEANLRQRSFGYGTWWSSGSTCSSDLALRPTWLGPHLRCDTGPVTITASLDRDAIRRAAERHGVAELAVFGSVVAGDFGAESDVDFLVDFLPDRLDPFEDFFSLRDDLREVLERDVDLVVKRSIRNPYFRESALSQAEILYAADI